MGRAALLLWWMQGKIYLASHSVDAAENSQGEQQRQ